MDVIVEDDSIVSVGPADLEARSEPGDFAGQRRFLIPGLFDCHIHLAFNGFRNVENVSRPNSGPSNRTDEEICSPHHLQVDRLKARRLSGSEA